MPPHESFARSVVSPEFSHFKVRSLEPGQDASEVYYVHPVDRREILVVRVEEDHIDDGTMTASQLIEICDAFYSLYHL